MARVAIIKIFTGLNLAPAQLSAELQAKGHDSLIVYFKDYVFRNENEIGDYQVPDDVGWLTVSGRERHAWNTYAPFSEIEFEHLFQVLEEFDPDIIGLSVYSSIVSEAALVSRRLEDRFPEAIIAWGGPAPTLTPERCIEHADVLCINEGEQFIVELADKVSASEDFSGIAGGWVKRADGTVQKNERRPLLDLKTIQIPDWNESRYVHINGDKVTRDSYPWNLMAPVPYGGKLFTGKQYVIMTQRGCPFSCSFCIESRYQEMFGKKNSLRRRTVDQVIEELVHAKEVLKVVSVWFYDDVFTVNPSWLREFLPRYKNEIGLPFWCYTYPTTHNLETLKLLKDAGCDSITMGVQSGSERLLREAYNRPTKINRVIEAAHEIVEAGLMGTIDLLTKSEFETVEDLEATFQFLLALDPRLKCWAFSEVTSYATYRYTEKKEKVGLQVLAQTHPSQTDYDFYHKLYRLTRTNCPRRRLARIPRDAKSRVELQGMLDAMLDRWNPAMPALLAGVDDKNNPHLDGEAADAVPHLDTKGDGHRVKGLTY